MSYPEYIVVMEVSGECLLTFFATLSEAVKYAAETNGRIYEPLGLSGAKEVCQEWPNPSQEVIEEIGR